MQRQVPGCCLRGIEPLPEVSLGLFSFCLCSTCVYFLLDSTCVHLLQGRSLLISLPPLPENGPDDESKFVEEEDDDEEIPSAHSPHEEVE